jgi:hypothetical protein
MQTTFILQVVLPATDKDALSQPQQLIPKRKRPLTPSDDLMNQQTDGTTGMLH